MKTIHGKMRTLLEYKTVSYREFLDVVLNNGYANGLQIQIKLGVFSIAEIPTIDEKIRERVTINHCVFSGYCDFRWLQRFSKHIQFNHCLFTENTNLIIDQVKCENLVFENCQLNECHLSNSAIEYTRFDNCTFKSLSVFECVGKSCKVDHWEESYSNESGKLDFYSPQTDSLSLYRISLQKLSIRSANEVFVSGNISDFNLSSENFQLVEIGFIGINTTIDSFRYTYNTLKGILSFQSVEIGTLTMEHLHSKDGFFKLQDVNISKTTLHDCSFGSFLLNVVKFGRELSILRCNLQGMHLFNVSWPKNKVLYPNPLQKRIPFVYYIREKYLKPEKRFTKEQLNNLSYQRDTYRQLKAAAISNHNHIESLDFYRNEMRLYWKEIRIKGGIPWYDRFLIFLNRWVSDFGQSWVLPLGWLLVINFLYLLCIDELQFSIKPQDWLSGFMKTIYYMNPARKLPDPNEYSTIRLGFDVLMRVENAFLIYHFLKATRRLVKM